MEIKKSSRAKLFLFLLILFAAQETAVLRAAETCTVLSGTLNGPCWEFASGARCDDCCKNEGHASGSCKIDFRCLCIKNCLPA